MRAHEIAAAVDGVLSGNENAEIQHICTDSRAIERDALFLAIRGEKFDGNAFIDSAFQNGATVVIGNMSVLPPKGKAYIRVKDSVQALGMLAAYHRKGFTIPVVGVTGSVGKTTTKEMIAAVLKTTYKICKTDGNFNNAIGLPLTVLGLYEGCEAAIIEMGMSARGEISYLTHIARPTIAVITNIGLSHIENLGTLENTRDAKLEIAEGLPAGGTLLVNGDDPYLCNVTLPERCVVRYGFDNEQCEIRGIITGENSFTVGNISITVPIFGRHNLYNALSAYAVGIHCGIAPADIVRGIAAYRPDGIRQSERKIRGDVTVLCDYYNASPASVTAALMQLKKGKAARRIAVLGDMLELGEHSQACHRDIGRKVAENGIDMLITVGNASRFAAEEAEKNGVETVSFSDNAALSAYLLSILKAGDRILIKGSHGMKMEEIFEKIR